MMTVKEVLLKDIKPYEKNPRQNDDAVKFVANSIREFGFKVPIVLDKNGVIVCGHTRYKAAMELGMKSVPCTYADDLTDEQIKAFRLADNKTSEIALWDFSMLDEELKEISLDMGDFGFDLDHGFSDDEYQSFFEEETEKKEKEPATVTCPHCGKTFVP